jgi:hypothetical protein
LFFGPSGVIFVYHFGLLLIDFGGADERNSQTPSFKIEGGFYFLSEGKRKKIPLERQV